jgi:hypothetical protein
MKEHGTGIKRKRAMHRQCGSRARWGTWVLASVAALVSLACSAQPAQNNRQESGGGRRSQSAKGDMSMPHLELNTSLKRSEVIAGESMYLTIVITNNGDQPVQVHSAQSRSPFVFQLLSAKDGAVIHTWSERQYELLLTGGDPLPPYTPPMVELAPGKSVTHENDLASCATEAVRPGRYRIVVNYSLGDQHYASPPVELSVVVPRIEAFTEVAASNTNNLATGFWHRNGDGSVSLFQRESQAGRPDLGVALRCLDRGTGAQIGGLALAAVVGDARGRRWFAWLEGDRLGTAFAGMKQRSTFLGPVPVGLTNPRLAPVGRKHDDGRAVFLVAGIEGGKVKVKEVTFTMRSTPVVRTIDLGASTVPERLLAHYQPAGADAAVTLLWPEVEGNVVRIYRRSFAPGQTAGQGERKLLLERPGPLAALEMAPLGPEFAGALFGPAVKQTACTYLRISLTDGKLLAEHALEAPKEKVDVWAIASAPLEDPPVLARAGDLLLKTTAKTVGGWRVTASGVREARHLQLHVLRGARLWVTWVDPQSGIEYRPLK